MDPSTPRSGLLQVDPRTGATSKFVEGLQMANGVARGAHGQIFASNALGTGIDRISGGTVELGWANVTNPNRLAVSTDKKYLYASQTLTAPRSSASPSTTRQRLRPGTRLLRWPTPGPGSTASNAGPTARSTSLRPAGARCGASPDPVRPA